VQQTTSAPVLELGAVDERKKLLVVDDDRSLAAQLVMEADALGMRMDIATDLSQARDAICCDRPHVVVLNLARLGQ